MDRRVLGPPHAHCCLDAMLGAVAPAPDLEALSAVPELPVTTSWQALRSWIRQVWHIAWRRDDVCPPLRGTLLLVDLDADCVYSGPWDSADAVSFPLSPLVVSASGPPAVGPLSMWVRRPAPQDRAAPGSRAHLEAFLIGPFSLLAIYINGTIRFALPAPAPVACPAGGRAVFTSSLPL